LRFLISFIANDQVEISGNILGIFNLTSGSLNLIPIPEAIDLRFHHGMGLCHTGDFLCMGIIPKFDRLTSYLLVIDTKTGRQQINKLNLTKAIHGITSIDYYRLLATSTQTDTIVEIALDENGRVVFEDIFIDLKGKEYYQRLHECALKNYPSCNYRADLKLDDQHHCNGICTKGNEIYFSAFNANYMGIGNGCIVKLPNYELVASDLVHPHTPMFTKSGDLVVCQSGDFKITNITKQRTFECSGYVRGIAEIPGGFLAGISKYRKFSKTENRWKEIHKDGNEINGAMVERIDINNNIHKVIDLSHYGVKEIFDIIPAKRNGKYTTGGA